MITPDQDNDFIKECKVSASENDYKIIGGFSLRDSKGHQQKTRLEHFTN